MVHKQETQNWSKLKKDAQAWINTHANALSAKKDWTAEDDKAYIEGVAIARNLPAARGFCSMAKRYPHEQRIPTLVQFLRLLVSAKVEPATRTSTAAASTSKPPADGAGLSRRSLVPERTASGESARHLDQYIHLLPQELQAKAAGIKHEYMLLSDYHHQAQIWADSNASDAQQHRKEIAEMILYQDDKIRLFWSQVDAVLKDHGQCPVSEEEKQAMEEQAAKLASKTEKGDGEYTYDELLHMREEAGEDAEQLERIAYLIKQRIENRKKYIRKPIQDNPQRRANVRAAIVELQQFGVKLSNKLVAEARKCGMTDKEIFPQQMTK